MGSLRRLRRSLAAALRRSKPAITIWGNLIELLWSGESTRSLQETAHALALAPALAHSIAPLYTTFVEVDPKTYLLHSHLELWMLFSSRVQVSLPVNQDYLEMGSLFRLETNVKDFTLAKSLPLATASLLLALRFSLLCRVR